MWSLGLQLDHLICHMRSATSFWYLASTASSISAVCITFCRRLRAAVGNSKFPTASSQPLKSNRKILCAAGPSRNASSLIEQTYRGVLAVPSICVRSASLHVCDPACVSCDLDNTTSGVSFKFWICCHRSSKLCPRAGTSKTRCIDQSRNHVQPNLRVWRGGD